ncbi:integrase core domain protein [Mycobacterium avium MAV_120709_2344]|nr:integrase core domain protein [Mycobacterium avium MAV_120709_2344]
MIRFIAEHKDHQVPGPDGGAGLRWGVEPMCAVLSEHGVPISASTYYEWITKTPTRRQMRDAELVEIITAARKDRTTGKFVQTLGSRKLWIWLRGQGHDVARCTVERIMREQGWQGARYGSKHKTTVTDETHVRHPDLVDRRFYACAPNRLWVADFTYVSTWSGFVYVAFVIDAFSRRIVGWRAATSMTTDLVLDAIEHAFFTRAAEGNTTLRGLIAHSDAGAQYTSVAFTHRLIDEGVDPSVGSVGDALDNALAETTVGSFKNELIRRQGPWRDVNHVEIATAHWVQWFNTERPHEYLDDFTPKPSRGSTTITDAPTKSGVIQHNQSPDSRDGSMSSEKPIARSSVMSALVAAVAPRNNGARAAARQTLVPSVKTSARALTPSERGSNVSPSAASGLVIARHLHVQIP